jgi:hypothetical protein
MVFMDKNPQKPREFRTADIQSLPPKCGFPVKIGFIFEEWKFGRFSPIQPFNHSFPSRFGQPMLDSPRDALYNAGGTAIRRDPTGRAGTASANLADASCRVDVLIR